MDIQSIYIIGSQSRSNYGSIVKLCTSGNITHVGLLFYVGRNNEPIPPVETSLNNQSQWIINNSVNINGILKIHIDSTNNNEIKLHQGFYVFETSGEINKTINTENIIKDKNQINGCVITPYETYKSYYKKNVIIKLKMNKGFFKLLIKQYWGRPYGINSIVNNVHSNLSMVCTHLVSRYINTVYTKTYNMFSPTKLIIEVGKLHNDNDYKEDDFLDKKYILYHYLWSSLPLIFIFVTSLFMFIYYVNEKNPLRNYNFKYNIKPLKIIK